MALLYKLPLGASILEQFISEIKGEKNALLILSNRYQMERVQFSGVPCTGIDTLANRILNENGYLDFERIDRRPQELLLEELITMMMGDGRFSYFANLTDKDGFLKSMTSFIGQLARTGLTTEEIVRNFKLWQEETGRTETQIIKDKEVLMLYQAYRNYLKQKNWYDLEGEYRLAVHLLKQEGTKIPWKKLRVFGFYSLDKLEIDLFRELAKHVDLSIAMYYGDSAAYTTSRDTYNSLLSFCKEISYTEKNITGPGAVLSKNIFGNNAIEVSSELPTNGIRLIKLASRDKEIRYVFTEIKKMLMNGVDVKDIVLVVRNLDKFSGLGAISEEYGIPISLGKSCRLSSHAVFSFVKLLYKAASETHDGAENYFKLLNMVFGKEIRKICLELKKDIFFTSSSFARKKVKETLGEDSYILETTNEFISSINESETIENFANVLKEYLKTFSFQRVLGEAYKKGDISLEGMKSNLEALRTLDNCLEIIVKDYKLCGREKELVNHRKWLDILTDMAISMNVSLSHGRADGVRIMEAANMHGLNYKYVYLLGLRREEFPASKNESWIYNDIERTGLHMDLETTYRSFDQDAYFFAATLASAKEKICITYFEEEAGEKSPYVDELLRVFLIKNDDKFDSNLRIEAVNEKDVVSTGELFEQLGLYMPITEGKDYVDLDSFILALENAGLERNGIINNRRGKLEDENVIEQVKKEIGSTFSASALNKYLNCPYAYLLDHIMGLGDGSFKEEEGTPADKGTIIHNTLSSFINNHLKEKLHPDEIVALQMELDEIFENAWEEAIAKGNVNNSEFWQAEKPRIHTVLSNWLIDEIKNQQQWNYKPLATELKFFGKKTNPMVKMRLSDGSTVRLNGAIDRIDTDGEKLFITDYKLSNSSVPTSTAMISGQDLQMNIYMLAAESIFEEPIAGGGYYVMNGLSRKRSLLFCENGLIKKDRFNSSFSCFEELKTAAKTFISEIIESIYRGEFIPSRNNCDFCPYMNVCRKSTFTGGKEQNNG